MDSFYSQAELEEIGFRFVGSNVKISRKTSIYGAENISIGSNTRIDDFSILSGRIEIGNHVHISSYVALYGGEEGIFIDDFAGVASHSTIYSSSDDYSGVAMTNPTVPEEYKNVDNRPVHIGRHVLIGSTSVVLPGVTLHEGCAFGCFSFITRDTEPWGLYTGIPVKRIKDRKKDILTLEKQMFAKMETGRV